MMSLLCRMLLASATAGALAPSVASAADAVEGDWRAFETNPNVNVTATPGGFAGTITNLGPAGPACLGLTKYDRVGKQAWTITAKANATTYTGTSVVDAECAQAVAARKAPSTGVPTSGEVPTTFVVNGKVLEMRQHYTLANPNFPEAPPSAASEFSDFTRFETPSASHLNYIDKNAAKVSPRRGGTRTTFTVRFPTRRDTELLDFSYYIDAAILDRSSCNSRVQTTRIDGGRGGSRTVKLTRNTGRDLKPGVTKTERSRREPGAGDFRLFFGKKRGRWCTGTMTGIVWQVERNRVTGATAIEALSLFKATVRATKR